MQQLGKIIVVLLAAALVHGQTSDDDFVETVIPNYTHNWYSGYLNITKDKAVHYVYQESQNDRDNDPLILWVSGGPGCSSLFTMLYEVGAFKFLTPGVPSFNVTKWGWNMKANLLFMETPGAVGFSTGPTNTSDDEATYDHLLALTAFLARFPTQKKNDLYLAGHGYAGILAPMLGKAISIRNQNPFYPKINFKGLLLGNPCINHNECYVGTRSKKSAYHYQYLFNHAFMTDQSWNQFTGACSMGYESNACTSRREQLDKLFDSANSSMYNIYEKCYKSAQTNLPNTGCEDEVGILTVLNDPGFQAALHVNQGTFNVCNEVVRANYDGTTQGSYSIMKELITAKKYKIVRIIVMQFIYSGDLSSAVPLVGTKEWISTIKEELDIPVRKTWREWWVPGKHPHEDQVGGMVWELEGMTYATVKSAGFMVGKDKPVALFEIYDAFLSGKRLPLTSRLSVSNTVLNE